MKISTHNHWDPLEEIIVGRADNARVPTVDRSTMSMCYTNYNQETIKPLEGAYPQWLIDEANEDIEQLVKTLEQAHVKVHRPAVQDTANEFSTPEWTSTGWYTWCPRDLLLPFDNLMIETPSPMRARYFETRAYHNIMLEAVNDGVEWIAAPKPILSDASYQFEEIKNTPSLTNLEPVFDAPNCVRLGRDILFQISNTGNHMGLQWLKNVLEHRGYRVHPAEHIYSYGHFDSTIIPLRPGLVLLNSTRVTPDNCPKLFDKWDKIYFQDVAPIIVPESGPGSVSPCSPYIGMNILSIDPNTVCIGNTQTSLMRELEKHKITCVPLPMRHAATLSGGFHCATLDLRRTGTLEDYFQ
jgi:N-dimethylarginine dimethylaminohydrolase